MRVLELPEALERRGLSPVLVAGWETRGNEFPSRPDGALRHWDAIASRQPTAGLRAITEGRRGANPLPGPLSQAYQSRHIDRNGLDIPYVVASGKANHAGRGEWNGIVGNYGLLGVEIAWSGPGEHFPAKRRLTSELIMRALLDCCAGNNPDDVAEHREYALPDGRKIDTNLDGNVLRRRMAELGRPGPPPSHAPQPAPAAGPDRLRGGEIMRPGHFLHSNNRCFTFHAQVDGNLVVYIGPLRRPDTAVWSSGTNGRRITSLNMQADGNLVAYDDQTPIWASGTAGYPGAYVIVQDDGNLVIYHGPQAIWDTMGHVR